MSGKYSLCKYGAQCEDASGRFEHPNGKVPCSGVPKICKFGTKCTNANCTFEHPDGKLTSLSGSNKVCRYGIKCTNADCTFEHPDGKLTSLSGSNKVCKYGIKCTNADCTFEHPDGKLTSLSGSNKVCRYGIKCTNADCTFEHPDGKLTSLSGSNNVCRYGINCTNADCTFEHPDGKLTYLSGSNNVCRYGIKCTNADCTFEHPDGKVTPFSASNKYGSKSANAFKHPSVCDDFDCNDVHPEEVDNSCRNNPCPNKQLCEDPSCEYDHPPQRQKPCRYGDSCHNFNCKYLHSTKWQACIAGSKCEDLTCKLNHPYSRGKYICLTGSNCFNTDCRKRHPLGHSVCPLLDICFDIMCCLAHPPTRPKVCAKQLRCKNSDCELLHPAEWDPSCVITHDDKWKSFKERQEDRKKVQLPILTCQQEFINRLKREKVVVVTAETGSGKTTQLPQYCAEAFEGLIVCTQPRALAAISISQRIAQEFDDTTPGVNVGYTVGGSNSVEGKKIMLMTDASLVRKAQTDRYLKQPAVSVLIIDEAHERSLNTDIVLGIAKLVLQYRPNDFYVVIASATIDPKPFLNFFLSGSNIQQPLQVSGRTYPVELEYANDFNEDEDLLKSGYFIPKVYEILNQYQEGHCLVFLPGSNEVDNAIRQFACNKEANPEWIALPLYGSLPPEEQSRVLNFDDHGGTLRMVLFCTNIAETSLTVPGVRLVIDTGLAKEARYDPKRRMTLLELVYISNSSADQRKGRAGRTAPGHCVRLFSPRQLIREHITPEILRSSLDLVMLQLCKIGYKPQMFPFIDPPERILIESSLQTLTMFKCLDVEQKITKRGELFNELPFDPRLSHFVLSAHEQYGHGDLASHIAAILSAPGSIFFMGGGKAGRDEVKRRVANEGSKHDSDLLYLQSIYKSWSDAGNVNRQTSTCNTCKKKLPSHLIERNNGCRACRICHSSKEGLNNKVLEIVQKNILSVMEIIHRRTGKPLSANEVEYNSIDAVEIIGRCLLEAFEDQLGRMVLPNVPNAGAYLFKSSTKVHLSNTTALAIARAKTDAPPFFVAMSVTQIPNGMTIADQAHPIRENWLTLNQSDHIAQNSLHIENCYSSPNLSKRFFCHLQKQLNSFKTIQEEKNQLAQFISCYYDSDQNTVCVFAPRQIASEVKNYASKIIDKKLREEREYETVVLIGKGSANATVIGGLHIHALEQIGLALRITYENPPVKSNDDLRAWVCDKAKLPEQAIKWFCYFPPLDKTGDSLSNPREAYAIVVFRDKVSAEKAMKICSTAKKEQGPKLFLKTKMDEHNARCLLNDLLPNPTHIAVVYSLRLRNIPPHYLTVHEISKLLKSFYPLDEQHVTDTFANAEITISGDQAFICLPKSTSQKIYQIAKSKIEQSDLGQQNFMKQITTKKGDQKTISVKLTADILPSSIVIFELLFADIEDCEEFATKDHKFPPDFELYSETLVRVEHHELFDIASIACSAAQRYSVEYKIRANKIILQGSPRNVGQCAQTLQSYVAPLKLHLGERKQQVLVSELHSNGKLTQDAHQCGVFVELLHSKGTHSYIYGLKIYGRQCNQGKFMNIFGNHSDRFEDRYKSVPYGPIIGSIFQNLRAGSKQLQTLQEETSNATIEFLRESDSIEIVVNPDVPIDNWASTIEKCKSKVGDIVKELCGSNRKVVDQTCVMCRLQEGRQFSICGHSCCKTCRNKLCEQFSPGLGVCCPLCSEVISIKDIQNSVPVHIFDEACTVSAKQFLHTQVDHPLAFCPQKNCNALHLSGMDYKQCSSCYCYVCVKCKIVDNPLHKGRNCKDFQNALQHQKNEMQNEGLYIETIFNNAKRFVNEHWSPELEDPTLIEENPEIMRPNCPAMDRYRNGMKEKQLLATPSTFFAWHGTSSEAALISICHNGFDPARRRGQAYGSGEYFGQTAEVSHGYANNTKRMIVAQLLNVSETSTHGNFCYVVNNPRDQQQVSFCLPVLVVTYDKTLHPLFHIKINEDCPFINQELVVAQPDWIAPYRWLWQRDDGVFQPYTDNVNSPIEEAYSKFICGIGHFQYLSPPIIRFVDDKPQVYLIDFREMTQMNSVSHFIRQVSHEEIKIPTSGSSWEYSDGMVWNRYESLVQGKIEGAFQAYIRKQGPSKFSCQFPGRPEIYELCFAQGLQHNTVTKITRSIRRT